MECSIGSRVVRGPNWKYQDQDKGLGNYGTVIKIGSRDSNLVPENTVQVTWDHGEVSTYRTGLNNEYDLAIIDNGPAGISNKYVY